MNSFRGTSFSGEVRDVNGTNIFQQYIEQMRLERLESDKRFVEALEKSDLRFAAMLKKYQEETLHFELRNIFEEFKNKNKIQI